MIDYEKEYDGILLHITNDPERLNPKELNNNLVQVSTVVGEKWASMSIIGAALDDDYFMAQIAKQLKKVAENA